MPPSTTLPLLPIFTTFDADAAPVDEAAADVAGEMQTSPYAWSSSGYENEEAERHYSAAVSEPTTVTPENAQESPALVQEIEEIERDYHHATKPWARGVVSMFILAHSGKFDEYVAQNGRLTDAGREFLSAMKDEQREIDPGVLPTERKEEARPPATEPQPVRVQAPSARAVSPAPAKAIDPREQRRLLEEMIALMKGGAGGSSNLAYYLSGRPTPEPLTERLVERPELIPIAAQLLDSSERYLVEATAKALDLVAWNDKDITPALPRLFQLIFPKHFGGSQNAMSPYVRAFAAAIRTPSSRTAALDLLEPKLSSDRSSERELAYSCLASARGERAIDLLAKGLGDSQFEIQKFARDSLRQLTTDQKKATSMKALYATIEQLFARSPGSRKLAAEVIEYASDKVPMVGSDQLVAAFCYQEISGPLTRALVNAARRIDTRLNVYQALLQGFDRPNVAVRASVVATIVKLLRDDKVSSNTEQWLLKSADNKSPAVRSGIALAWGRAAKEGHILSRNEREVLATLKRDRDPKVREQATWALAQVKGGPEPAETESSRSDAPTPAPAEKSDTGSIAAASATEGPKTETAREEDPLLSEAEIREELAERNESIWFEAQPKVLKALRAFDLDTDGRHDLMKSLLEVDDFHSPMRTAELYAEIALESSLSAKEIQMLLERRAIAFPLLREQLDHVFNKARTARRGSNFLSREAYFQVMERALKGEFGDWTADNAHSLLKAAASNISGGDKRAGDLLRKFEEKPEPPPPPEPPKAPPAKPQTPPLVLDPQIIAKDFIEWDVIGIRALNQRVDQWIQAAERDPLAAHRIREAMRRAVEIIDDRPQAVRDVVEGYFRRFLYRNLLTQTDIELLLELQLRLCRYRAGEEISALLNAAGMDMKLAPLLEAARSARAKRNAAKGSPTPARKQEPLFNPEALANLFRGRTYPMIRSHIDGMLSLARRDSDTAREAMAAMWQAVEIANGDVHTLICLSYHLFGRFAEANLVTQDDWEKLLRLGERYPEVDHDISLMTRDKQLVSPRQATLIAAALAAMQSPQQPAARGPVPTPPSELQGAEGPAAFADMPPDRRNRIESLVRDLLHGDTKARKKAAAEWAKFVGEKNADSHAWPMLQLALSRMDDAMDQRELDAAAQFLANAIAKETNWPEKKLDLLRKALASSDPRVRAGAARVFGALSATAVRFDHNQLSVFMGILVDEQDERARACVEDAVIAIARNPGNAWMIKSMTVWTEIAEGAKLESLKRILAKLGR